MVQERQIGWGIAIWNGCQNHQIPAFTESWATSNIGRLMRRVKRSN